MGGRRLRVPQNVRTAPHSRYPMHLPAAMQYPSAEFSLKVSFYAEEFGSYLLGTEHGFIIGGEPAHPSASMRS